MRLRFKEWKNTFTKLGYKLVTVPSKVRAEAPPFSVEELEVRQLLSASVTNVHLNNDTGANSTDLVTNDPTLEATLSGNFFGGSVKVEFDHHADGQVDGSSTYYTPQSDFTYDPRLSDSTISTHVGPISINYRTIEYNFMQQPIDTSSWSTFSFTLQDDTAPSLQVVDDAFLEVADGTGVVAFGDTDQGTSVDKTFTVHNWGNQALTLNANTLQLPTGFSLVGNFGGTIASGSSDTFTIRLDATYDGFKTGTVSFNTNDPGVPTFDFTVTGNVESIAPDIEITQLTGEIIDNSTGLFDYGSTAAGTVKTATLIIKNQGNTTLNLDLNSISVPGGFTVTQNPAATISALGQTSLMIQLDAATVGEYTGVFSIDSDDADEPTYSFDLFGNVTANATDITVDFFKLVNDTGTSGSDRITYDPRVKGEVNGDFIGGAVQIEFDHSGDGIANGNKIVLNSGDAFEYDPRLSDANFANGTGSKSVDYRFVHFDVNGVELLTGSWKQFQIVLEDDPTLGDLTLDHFGLLFDTGYSNQDGLTTSPSVGGIINGTIGSGHVAIEFDHFADGVVNGSAIVTESGETFAYDPRETDEAFEDLVGPVALNYRLVKFDSAGAVLDTGNWATLNFVLELPPAGDYVLESLNLRHDTGDSDSDNITTDSSFEGAVLNPNENLRYVIDIDLDGDGDVDAHKSVDSLFNFAYRPKNLGYGQNTVSARVTYWDPDYDAIRKGTWTDLTFTLDPLPAPGIETLDLANDTGEVTDDLITLDPTLRGRVDGTNGSNKNVPIDIDTDNDGIVDLTAQTDSDGNFEFQPDIAAGSHTIKVRAKRFDAILDDYVNGEWSEITFELEAVETANLTVLRLWRDTGDDAEDNITNDRRLFGRTGGIDDLYGTQIEFDHGSDGSIDGTTTTDSTGRFHYDPLLIGTGAVNVRARTTAENPYTGVQVYGDWVDISYTIEGYNFTNVQIVDYGLFQDTGASDTDNITSNPLLQGNLYFANASSDEAGRHQIEIDEDGDGVTDYKRLTRDDGSFRFHPSDVQVGNNTIRVRGRTWNYQTASYAYTGWNGFTFNYQPSVNSAAEISDFELVSDTGTNSTDKITANSLLTGTVANEEYVYGITVEFDEDADGVVDGVAFTNEAGEFYYQPGPMSFGSTTISARPVEWNYDAEQFVYGNWTDLTFTFANQVNVAPRVVSVGLSNDNLGSPDDLITSDPTISGRLVNEAYLEGIVVEFDFDGDNQVDQTTLTDAQGRFEASPIWLDPGGYSVQVRAREIDYLTGDLLVGNWVTLAFTLQGETDDLATIDNIGLLDDNGDNGSDNITTDPTLSGNILNDDGLGGVTIEFDHDNDGVVDGYTTSIDIGSFEYFPSGLELGSNTIRARISEADINNDTQKGPWSFFTFTLTASEDTSIQFDSYGIANDTGNSDSDESTADATVSGTVANTDPADETVVEFDTDGDGYADGSAIPAGDGSFSFAPTDLDEGYQNISARIVSTDEFGYEYSTSWSSIGFVYHSDPDGAEAQSIRNIFAGAESTNTTAKDTLTNSLREITRLARESRQTAITNAATAIANAKSSHRNSTNQADSVLATAIRQAEQNYLAQVTLATDAYRAGLTNEQYFDLGEFELPELPPILTPDYTSDLLDANPPVEFPDYNGENFDLSKDTQFLDDLDQADKDYHTALDQAESDFRTQDGLLEDAYEAAKSTAESDYSQAYSVALIDYLAAVGNYSSTTNFNKLGFKSDADKNKQDGLAGRSHDAIQNEFDQKVAELIIEFSFSQWANFGNDLENWELFVERFKQLEKERDEKIATAEHQSNLKTNAADTTRRNSRAEAKRAQAIHKIDAYYDFLEIVAEKVREMEVANATALKNFMDERADKIQILSDEIALAAKDKRIAKAQAEVDAKERFKNADSANQKASYEYELAVNKLEFVQAVAQKELEHLQAQSLADNVQARSNNTAINAYQVTLAGAQKKRTMDRIRALNEFQAAEVNAEKALTVDRNNALKENVNSRSKAVKDYRYALAAARKTYEVALAIASGQLDNGNASTELAESYRIAKIDAKEVQTKGYSAAEEKYHQDFVDAEKSYVDKMSIAFQTYDKALAKSDHQPTSVDHNGVTESGFYSTVAGAGKILSDAFSLADKAWWETMAPQDQTFWDFEATEKSDLTKANAEDSQTFVDDVAGDYHTNVQTWSDQVDTSASRYQVRRAEIEKRRAERWGQNQFDRSESMADAQLQNETEYNAAYKDFVIAEANADHQRSIGLTTETLAAINREQKARKEFEEAVADKLKDHEDQIVLKNEIYQDAIASENEKLQNEIDKAERTFEKVNDPTDQAAIDARIASIKAAEIARAKAVVAAWKTSIDLIAAEKVTFATHVKTEVTTWTDKLKTSNDTLADAVYGLDTDYANLVADTRATNSNAQTDADKDLGDTTSTAQAESARETSSTARERLDSTAASLDQHANEKDVQLADALTSAATNLWQTFFATAATARKDANATKRTADAAIRAASSGVFDAFESDQKQAAIDQQTSTSDALRQQRNDEVNALKGQHKDFAEAYAVYMRKLRKDSTVESIKRVKAEVQFDLDATKATEKKYKDISAAWKTYVDAGADNQVSFQLGLITSAPYEAAKLPLETQFKDDKAAAELQEVKDFNAARIARIQAIGNALQNFVSDFASGEITLTDTMNSIGESIVDTMANIQNALVGALADAASNFISDLYDANKTKAQSDKPIQETNQQNRADQLEAEIKAAAEAFMDSEIGYANQRAIKAVAWANSENTDAAQFEALKAAGQHKFLEAMKPAFVTYIENNSADKAALWKEQSNAEFDHKIARINNDLDHHLAQSPLNKIHRQNLSALEGQRSRDNAAAVTAFEQASTLSETNRWLANTASSITHLESLVESSNVYREGMVSTTDPDSLYATMQNERAESVHTQAVDVSNNDYAWSVDVSTGNQTIEDTHANDDLTESLAFNAETKTYGLQVGNAKLLLAKQQDDVGLDLQTANVTSNVNFAYDQAVTEAEYLEDYYAAHQTAVNHIATLSTEDWVAFEQAKAAGLVHWWNEVSDDFIAKADQDRIDSLAYHAANSTAYQAKTDTNQLAEQAHLTSSENAIEAWGNDRATFYRDYTESITTEGHLYTDTKAAADRDHLQANSLANKNLAIGEVDGNQYTDQDHTNDKTAADSTFESTETGINQVYASGYTTARVGHNDAVSTSYVSYVDTQSTALRDLENASSDALNLFEKTVATNDKILQNDLAANDAAFEILSANQLVSSYQTVFGGTPSIREQLQIDLADANADLVTDSQAAFQAVTNSYAVAGEILGHTVSDASQTLSDDISDADWTERTDAALASKTYQQTKGASDQTLADSGNKETDKPNSPSAGEVLIDMVLARKPANYFESIPLLEGAGLEEIAKRSAQNPHEVGETDGSNNVDIRNFKVGARFEKLVSSGLLNTEHPDGWINPYSSVNDKTTIIDGDEEEETEEEGQSGESQTQTTDKARTNNDSLSLISSTIGTVTPWYVRPAVAFAGAGLSHILGNVLLFDTSGNADQDEQEKPYERDQPKGMGGASSPKNPKVNSPVDEKERIEIFREKFGENNYSVAAALKFLRQDIMKIKLSSDEKFKSRFLTNVLLIDQTVYSFLTDNRNTAAGKSKPPLKIEIVRKRGWEIRRGVPVNGGMGHVTVGTGKYSEIKPSLYYDGKELSITVDVSWTANQIASWLIQKIHTMEGFSFNEWSLTKLSNDYTAHLFSLHEKILGKAGIDFGQVWRKHVLSNLKSSAETAQLYVEVYLGMFGPGVDVANIIDAIAEGDRASAGIGSILLALPVIGKSARWAVNLIPIKTASKTVHLTPQQADHLIRTIVKEGDVLKKSINPRTNRAYTSDEIADALARRTDELVIVDRLTCFVAGTPVLTPTGFKNIEEMDVGDSILSRPDYDLGAPINVSQVEKTFESEAKILEIDVNGHTIRTTKLHPFYVENKGWVAANELEVGDELSSLNLNSVNDENRNQNVLGGSVSTVQSTNTNTSQTILAIRSTEKSETVYNLSVAIDHTYFVGKPDWGFAVWVHNDYEVIGELGNFIVVNEKTGKAVLNGGGFPTKADAEAYIAFFSDKKLNQFSPDEVKNLNKRYADALKNRDTAEQIAILEDLNAPNVARVNSIIKELDLDPSLAKDVERFLFESNNPTDLLLGLHQRKLVKFAKKAKKAGTGDLNVIGKFNFEGKLRTLGWDKKIRLAMERAETIRWRKTPDLDPTRMTSSWTGDYGSYSEFELYLLTTHPHLRQKLVDGFNPFE